MNAPFGLFKNDMLLTDSGYESVTERLAGQRANHGRLPDAGVS